MTPDLLVVRAANAMVAVNEEFLRWLNVAAAGDLGATEPTSVGSVATIWNLKTHQQCLDIMER